LTAEKGKNSGQQESRTDMICGGINFIIDSGRMIDFFTAELENINHQTAHFEKEFAKFNVADFFENL